MPAPVSYPYGPWSFNNGVPTPAFNPQYTAPNYQPATFFTFGPSPHSATIANCANGTTSIPFVPLIFDETPNVWADSMLSTAQLSASVRANSGIFWS